jgi:hypothetical protein
MMTLVVGSTCIRAPLTADLADLEDTLVDCLASLPDDAPTSGDLQVQARVAYAGFLRALIRLEERQLTDLVQGPPAVC